MSRIFSIIPSSAPSVIWKVYTSPESSRHNRVVHGFCILRCVLNANNMSPTRRTRNTSTLADPGHIPADLDLGRLYVKDLRSLCSRLNLPTTGGRAALIKRIDGARQLKHRQPLWHSAPYSRLRRALCEPKCNGNAVPTTPASSPRASGSGVATRWAFVSYTTDPSTIHRTGVFKRGDRKSRISRSPSRSSRFQWLAFTSSRSSHPHRRILFTQECLQWP